VAAADGNGNGNGRNYRAFRCVFAAVPRLVVFFARLLPDFVADALVAV
jgi:hypothetical protein